MRQAKRFLCMAGSLALMLVACEGSREDSVVGNTCSQNAQCRFICATGGDFPGGFCTVPCLADNQCPRGDTLCISKNGGVCLFTCLDNSDCRFLGPGWACRDKDRIGGGKAFVCIGD